MKTRVILIMVAVAAAITFAQPATDKGQDSENPRARFGRQSERQGFQPRMDRAQCGREQCTGCICPFAAKTRGADFDSERNPEFERKMAFMRWNAFRRLREADTDNGDKDFAADRQSRRGQWGENRNSYRPEQGRQSTDGEKGRMRGGRGYNSGYCPYNTQPRIYGMSERAQKYAPPVSITGEQRGMHRKSEADNKGKDATGDSKARWQRAKEQPQAGGDGLELKLKLRGAIMEKDYDQAKRIIDKLAEIDD